MTREQALERAVEMVRHARSHVEDVEYSPMDATRSDLSYLCEVVEAVIQAGAVRSRQIAGLPSCMSGETAAIDRRARWQRCLSKLEVSVKLVTLVWS